jgi:hypothetical protein
MAVSALEVVKGRSIGRDPRSMTAAELKELGHEPMPRSKALRAACIACQGGHPGAVRKCAKSDCGAWPYRMGGNPFSTRKANPAGSAALAKAREAAKQRAS